MTVTLVVLPPKQLSDALVELSGQIAQAVASDYVLGALAHPHITLVQWDTDTPDQILERLRGISWDRGTVTLAGLALVPGPDGETWLEIPSLCSRWLRRSQELGLECTAGLGQVGNGVRDEFRPHATVGLTLDDPIQLDGVLSFDLLRSTTSGWRIAFGESGENFVLARVLVGLSR